MVKRVASLGLWFIAVGWGLNLFAAVAGVSQVPGLAFAAAVAAFVGLDPLHLFWPVARPTAPRRVEFETAAGKGALVTR